MKIKSNFFFNKTKQISVFKKKVALMSFYIQYT